MKKLVYLILLLSFSAFSQNEMLFEEANRAYMNSNYQEAVGKYEKILENGETSAEVYFNLGNAYYRMDEVAPSIYYLEKALQLAPGDRDIQNNLAIARNTATDAIGEYQSTGFSSFGVGLGINGWEWLSVMFGFGFLILFGLYYFSISSKRKKLFFATAVVSGILAFASVGVAYFQQQEKETNDFAIVFSEVIEVKGEPNPRSQAVFELHEGAKLKVLENFQDWVKVELPDGKQGWMQRQNLRFL